MGHPKELVNVHLGAHVYIYVHFYKCMVILEGHTGSRMLVAIVKRCRLNHAFELWCIAFAAASQWKEVNTHLKGLLERTCKGWLLTRINEKANKVLRDAGTRDNASKAYVRLFCYR